MSFDVGHLTYEWARKQKHLNVSYFKSLPSTNTHAKEELGSFQFPHLIITDHQPQGRGRSQNTWISPPSGHGLLISYAIKPQNLPQSLTAPRFGLATYRALKKAIPSLSLGLKPPNDLYVQNKKLGGILMESSSQGNHFFLIFGLGLNVFSHPDIQQSTSLSEHTSITQDQWVCFLDALYQELTMATQTCTHGKLTSQEQQDLLSALQAQTHIAIKNIDPNGNLTLTDNTFISWRDL